MLKTKSRSLILLPHALALRLGVTSFDTGPSRTGDIERILVLGAHGPKELIVVLVGESP